MSTRVRMCMDRLRALGIFLDDYAGDVEIVACELLTADAVLSNIAQKILMDSPLSPDLKASLRISFLQGTHHWRMPDGTAFDLAQIPLLKQYGQQIERLRIACEEAAQTA